MKISIITATYNSASTIKDTIESILGQTYTDFEHIIVDGLSKDNTLEIVKSYEDKYNGRLKIISEKDSGLYDAMNKGVKNAAGDVIGILNSDDVYADETVLEKIAEKFKETNCDATYGNLIYMDETMQKPVRFWKEKPNGELEKGWQIAHPTLYLTKAAYQKVGGYNLKYRIAADYDFVIRLMLDKDLKKEYIDYYLVHMRTGGTSTDGFKGYKKSLKDSYNVLKDNGLKHPKIINFRRVVKTIFNMVKPKRRV